MCSALNDGISSSTDAGFTHPCPSSHFQHRCTSALFLCLTFENKEPAPSSVTKATASLSWARSPRMTRWRRAVCSSSAVGHRTQAASGDSCRCWRWEAAPDRSLRYECRRQGRAPEEEAERYTNTHQRPTTRQIPRHHKGGGGWVVQRSASNNRLSKYYYNNTAGKIWKSKR